MPKPAEKNPAETETDLENGGTGSEGNDGNEGKPDDPAVAAIAAVKPTGNEEVDKLVRAALAEVLPGALQAALSAQQAEATRIAAEKTAREQGDFKALFEASEEKRKSLELDKWRGEALREAGLDAKWFDSIQGSTKEEMLASAKKFKKHLDDEVAARAAMTVEEHPGTPRGGGKSSRTRNDKPTAAQKTGSALRAAFGTGHLASTR